MSGVEIIKARNTLSPRARTNLTKRLRVAAYCRVSTDSEDQLNSYKSQVAYYTELIIRYAAPGRHDPGGFLGGGIFRHISDIGIV